MLLLSVTVVKILDIAAKVNFLFCFMLIFLYRSEYVYAYVEYIETREVTLSNLKIVSIDATLFCKTGIPFIFSLVNSSSSPEI